MVELISAVAVYIAIFTSFQKYLLLVSKNSGTEGKNRSILHVLLRNSCEAIQTYIIAVSRRHLCAVSHIKYLQ